MKSFTEFIQSKVFITDEILQEVVSKFQEKEYAPHQVVLKRGQIANQYYFIISVGLRFFSDENENEHTAWAFFKGEFITEISSLAPRKPTRFTIETIDKTRLLVIERADMESLYARFPVWQEFGRKIWEDICIQQIEQNVNYQTLTAEGIYLKLMENREFIQKMPVKQLASILGITPNALSRIRRNIK